MNKYLAALLLIPSIVMASYGEKVVAEKDTAVVNRFSGVDYFFGNGSITKSQTIYYLISEDGDSCEVIRQTYYKTKVGDVVSCMWE